MLRTERLILRPWRDEDFEPFAQMNRDPHVMECFPAPLTTQESNQFAKHISTKLQEQGWGLWAVSVQGGSDFIGFIGLSPVTLDVHFRPAIEVGWRLAYDYWGKGYATEGALEALKYGFDILNLSQIVSFTAVQNRRSIEVMKRIGLRYDPADDFNNPNFPEGHVLCPHVLYRLNCNEWMEKSITTFDSTYIVG